MAQQLIYLPSDFQQLLRRLLLQYSICYFHAVRLPVRFGDFEIACQVWPLHLHRFEHQHGFSKIPLRCAEDGVPGGIRKLKVFSLGNVLKARRHLASA